MFAFATRRLRSEKFVKTIKNYIDIEVSEENKDFFSKEKPIEMHCYYYDNYLPAFRELEGLININQINLK